MINEAYIDVNNGTIFIDNMAGLHSSNVSTYANYIVFDEVNNGSYFILDISNYWESW